MVVLACSLALTGCGGSSARSTGQAANAESHRSTSLFTGSQVARTFRTAGIRLHHFGSLPSVEQYFDQKAFDLAQDFTINVGVFASLRLAQKERRLVATFRTGRRVLSVPSFAATNNVVVWIAPSVSPSARQRIIHALANLRNGHIPPPPKAAPPLTFAPHHPATAQTCFTNAGYRITNVSGNPAYVLPPQTKRIAVFKWTAEPSKVVILEFAESSANGETLERLVRREIRLAGGSPTQVRESAGRHENVVWYLTQFSDLVPKYRSILDSCIR